jgi:hypothetical protein
MVDWSLVGETRRNSGKMLPQYRFMQQTFHMKSPGIETGNQRLNTDLPCEDMAEISNVTASGTYSYRCALNG